MKVSREERVYKLRDACLVKDEMHFVLVYN